MRCGHELTRRPAPQVRCRLLSDAGLTGSVQIGAAAMHEMAGDFAQLSRGALAEETARLATALLQSDPSTPRATWGHRELRPEAGAALSYPDSGCPPAAGPEFRRLPRLSGIAPVVGKKTERWSPLSASGLGPHTLKPARWGHRLRLNGVNPTQPAPKTPSKPSFPGRNPSSKPANPRGGPPPAGASL